MNVGQSIRKLRESNDLTQEQFGAIAGVSSMAVSQWENGRAVPRMGSIQKLSDYFGVPKSVIMGDTAKPAHRLAPVPLYGSVAAGVPIEMIQVEEMREAPSKYVEDDPDSYLVRVRGTSMNRVIPDGSFALVSPRHTDVNPNGMYLVTVNGDDATIKHVRRLENGVELVPDSYDPTYRPKVYDFGEEGTPPVKVLGEVMWWCKEF